MMGWLPSDVHVRTRCSPDERGTSGAEPLAGCGASRCSCLGRRGSCQPSSMARDGRRTSELHGERATSGAAVFDGHSASPQINQNALLAQPLRELHPWWHNHPEARHPSLGCASKNCFCVKNLEDFHLEIQTNSKKILQDEKHKVHALMFHFPFSASLFWSPP